MANHKHLNIMEMSPKCSILAFIFQNFLGTHAPDPLVLACHAPSHEKLVL